MAAGGSPLTVDDAKASDRQVSTAVRGAAVMYVLLGAGFGIGAVATISHLDRHGELPITPFGFRSMGGGLFEQLDVGQFSALGWLLVGVCALDVLAGVWLWQGRRRGAYLGLATSPLGFALGAGFALPFLLAGVPIRAALVIAGRRTLQ